MKIVTNYILNKKLYLIENAYYYRDEKKDNKQRPLATAPPTPRLFVSSNIAVIL